MSVAAAIRGMLDAGLSIEQALIAIEQMERAKSSAAKSNAQRQADWRARQKEARNENNVTPVTVVTEEAKTLPSPDAPLFLPPDPLRITPLKPPSNTNAVAGANENSDPAEAGDEADGDPDKPAAKARASPTDRGTRLPDGYWPAANTIDFCKKKGLTDERIAECVAEFSDFWTGVPGQRGRKCDWESTFRNAVRNIFASVSRPRQANPGRNGQSGSSIFGAYQRASAFVQAEGHVPRERANVLDL